MRWADGTEQELCWKLGNVATFRPAGFAAVRAALSVSESAAPVVPARRRDRKVRPAQEPVSEPVAPAVSESEPVSEPVSEPECEVVVVPDAG